MAVKTKQDSKHGGLQILDNVKRLTYFCHVTQFNGMEIVSEGSLECISRPASTSKRSSSRSSVRSVSSSVQHSLDILPPEEPTLSWSTNFEVESDVIVTDVTEDVSSDNDHSAVLDDEGSLETKFQENYSNAASNSQNETGSSGPTEEQDHSDLLENETLTASDALQVKEEQHENSKEIIECSTVLQEENSKEENSESSSAGNNENKDLDPKIRKGMERIKKLDNILCEKVKREKEVKKQRLDQERMWREQLEMLEKTRNADLGKPVDLGPAHVLALGAPNETEESVSEESPPVTPLFATQPLVDEEILLQQKSQEEHSFQTQGYHGGAKAHAKGDDMSTGESKNKTSHGKAGDDKARKNHRNNKRERKMRKKDFIKRNILLAADANNMVAMTKEEKKRLEEILSDMGDLMEESSAENDSLIRYGHGFVPSQDEARQLADIDIRLQSLLPSEEYAALCEQTEQDKQYVEIETPRSVNSSFLSEEEMPTFGELVLQEKKETREMKQRLMAIEDQLQRFQNEDHIEGILSESLLRQLLDDSSRTTSQATTILDRVASTTLSFETTSSFDGNSVISSVSSTPVEER